MVSLVKRQHSHHSGKAEYPNPLLRDPLQLITDFIFLIFTLVYIPFRNLLRTFLQKPKSLKGKVCLVTGSGRGLGRELCLELAREGAIIACADINEDNNIITVHKLKDMEAKAKGYKLNVANKEEVDLVVRQVEEDLGPVYMLVNNAAIIVPSNDLNEDYTRATFNVNTLGPIWMTMAVLPGMKSRNSGHIVNISSICGLYGTPVLTTYAASKAALSNFSQSLRLELSFEPKNHIHVTCVHPDVINTSEDYVEMLNTRLSARDVRTVTADIMRAIKYNKTDVSSPSFYYYIYALNVLFPSEVIHKFIKLLDVTIATPSQEELDKMPVSELVRCCRPPRDSEETMRLLAQDRPRHQEHKSRRISFTTLGHQVCEANSTNHGPPCASPVPPQLAEEPPTPPAGATIPAVTLVSSDQPVETEVILNESQLPDGTEQVTHDPQQQEGTHQEQNNITLNGDASGAEKEQNSTVIQHDQGNGGERTPRLENGDALPTATPPPTPSGEPALETFSIRSLRESSDQDLAKSIKSLREVGLKTSASQVFSVPEQPDSRPATPSAKELD